MASDFLLGADGFVAAFELDYSGSRSRQFGRHADDWDFGGIRGREMTTTGRGSYRCAAILRGLDAGSEWLGYPGRAKGRPLDRDAHRSAAAPSVCEGCCLLTIRAKTLLLVAVTAWPASESGRYTGAAPTRVSTVLQGSSAATPSQDATARLRGKIRTIEELLAHPGQSGFSDRGAALYLLAVLHTRLDDQEKALKLLEECVALDQGFNPGEDSDFDSLKGYLRFRELVAQVQRRYPPVHHAQVAFTVRQADLFPEGLAVDAVKRLFYMGSMHHKKIVKFALGSEVSDFVPEGRYELMPVGGVHVEPGDHSVWCATDAGKRHRSEIAHFDAQGKLLERYDAPEGAGHDFNDLVLRDTREIYATDTEGNRVYRFDRRARRFVEVKLSRPMSQPNGITLSGDGDVLYIADDLGLTRLDLRTNESRDVAPAARDSMGGVDGLYWHKGSLVGIQYGTGANRVMRWKLSGDGRRVESSEVLERGTEMVKNPTTGAILDDRLYFMANTGIHNLQDDQIVDTSKLEPVKIAVMALRQ
jgi:sugar lactone lactonase YvrE